MYLTKLMTPTIALLLLCTSEVHAETYHCEGYDASANKVSLVFDEAAGSVDINGQLLRVEIVSSNKSSIAEVKEKLHDVWPGLLKSVELENITLFPKVAERLDLQIRDMECHCVSEGYTGTNLWGVAKMFKGFVYWIFIIFC